MENKLEHQLIERCRKGESQAFSQLIKLYRRQLYSYLWRLCGSRGLADDVFQDTLIKVWKGIDRYDHKDKFSSWLFSIAHNVAIDALRKYKVRSNIIHTDEIHLYGTDSNPCSELIGAELQEIMGEIVNNLPEKQKQVFLLREHGDMTFKEIAELINEPLNTVLGHMHYAVEKIKRALRKKDAI
ncbi:MAG: RNA polymerase sigma factor [Syntrophothermus sp.]